MYKNGMGMLFRSLFTGAFFILILIKSIPILAQATWARTYGGASEDGTTSIQQTFDGGYIVAGWTDSFGAGGTDFMVLKLDPSGNIIWQKTYGGAGWDGAYSIQQTSDGGFIAAGWTDSFGAGDVDLWALKLDFSGNIQWQKVYRGKDIDIPFSIQQTSDDGYIIAGYTFSYGAGGADFLVIKLDLSGNIKWQRTYGDVYDDIAYSVKQTSDGSYIITGYYSDSSGLWDILILKLTADGDIVWQRAYVGTGNERGLSIQQTSDDGYVVAGDTNSFGAGIVDFLVLKLDSSGNIMWQKAYGGATLDSAVSIQQTSDDGYIVAGLTIYSGSNSDFLIIKIDSYGELIWQKSYGTEGNDQANSIKQATDGGYIVAGNTNSFGAGDENSWVLKTDSSGDIDSSCTFISDIYVTSTNTTITATNANVTSGTPTETMTDTLISGVDSNVTVPLQCSGNQCLKITLSPIALQAGIIGTFYSQALQADGGASPYSYLLAGGALPGGLSLSAEGIISGIPTNLGTATFTVEANDSKKCAGSMEYYLSINPEGCQTISIQPPILPGGYLDYDYYQIITASGGASPYTYSVTSGSLPIGIIFSPDGTLSGILKTTGVFNFNITATDAFDCTGNQEYSISVNSRECPFITILPSMLQNGTVGENYYQALIINGSEPPYTFIISSGALPSGWNLSYYGVISGTASTAGSYNFTVTVANSNGCYASKKYSLEIYDVCQSINMSPSVLPDGIVGTPYNQAINASGGSAPYVYSIINGSLPPGLLLSEDGTLYGIPTYADQYPFSVEVFDSNYCTSIKSYTLSTISPAPPSITAISKRAHPFRLNISGANFHTGVRIYIGSDVTPWGNIVYKGSDFVILKGGKNLKAKFPSGKEVRLKVINQDGGYAIGSFTR